MAWWDPTVWGWLTSGVTTVIGAGVGTAIVQGGLALYRDQYQKESHAAYMAMRLAVTLEAHAAACLDLIARNDAEEPHPDGRFTGNATLPLVAPYPDDAEGWRAIDRRLAGRCLSLPLKIHANQVKIGWTGTFVEDDWDNVGGIVNTMAAERGVEAWELARDLRHKHKIEGADEALNCSGRLTEVLEKARQTEADRWDREREQRPMPNRS
jgi:hypothetical protein